MSMLDLVDAQSFFFNINILKIYIYIFLNTLKKNITKIEISCGALNYSNAT
jgi:hypothetical protein